MFENNAFKIITTSLRAYSGVPNSRTYRNKWTFHMICRKTNSRTPILHYIYCNKYKSTQHVFLCIYTQRRLTIVDTGGSYWFEPSQTSYHIFVSVSQCLSVAAFKVLIYDSESILMLAITCNMIMTYTAKFCISCDTKSHILSILVSGVRWGMTCENQFTALWSFDIEKVLIQFGFEEFSFSYIFIINKSFLPLVP